jgi:hypothetical protein
MSGMPTGLRHELEIRRLIDGWAIWRDSLDWERLRSVWHDDGRMVTLWWQGPRDEFIRRCREVAERGAKVSHFLGGSVVDVLGRRAVAQTKATIGQRAIVDGVLCDVEATGRFYDFFEYRDGKWGLVLRQPIYEHDRLSSVNPAATVQLDMALLDTFPEGYRHLAYIQARMGYHIDLDMPGPTGSQADSLYASGARWLAGESLDR